ncbi:MAG: Arc family DNA-binding protein [Candidatus Competibacterales bacterium]|nr:Arc family DNA-binding protein [Candidatus Competibacterales bacterium]
MAQVLVRNLDEDTKAKLKQRAQEHGWSMEEEIRQILQRALNDTSAPIRLGSRIAARFAGEGLDTPLPEWRGKQAMPMDFRE